MKTKKMLQISLIESSITLAEMEILSNLVFVENIPEVSRPRKP